MTTAAWKGNAAAVAAVEKAQVTAVGVGGTLVATLNTKVISYTVVTGDTVATATAAWLAMLAASTAPPEFLQLAWSASGSDSVLATAKSAGTPFAGMTNGLVFSATGGCTVVQTTVTANSSPSDVFDARNWTRGSGTGLPQDNDDLVIANSAVPLLWNLDKLKAVKLTSVTRWQTFTGTIGLPENNPAGFVEWRPTYFQLLGGGTGSSSGSSLGGSASALNVVLGFGLNGNGPTRERYDFQAQQINCAVLASGSAQDDYAVRVLGTNPSNFVSVVNTSVGIAMLPGEIANLASATVGGGGTLDLGPGATLSGTLTVTGGGSGVNGPCGAIVAQDAAQIAQGTVAGSLTLTYPSITVKNQSTLTWLSGSTVTSLTLQTGSAFNKSLDVRPMTVTLLTLDWNNCLVNDPYNAVTFGKIVTNNALQSGPFRCGPGARLPINP